jgi:hypothetical protein
MLVTVRTIASFALKKKVKLSVCLTKHCSMKAYEGLDVQIQILLTSALVGGEWSASHPCPFTLGVRAHGTHWIGGWVGDSAVIASSPELCV